MRLKYRRFSKLHLQLFYEEEARRLGILDEWREAKKTIVLFKPIVAKYVGYEYHIPYGLNYVNFYPNIYPEPIIVNDSLQDEKFIEYLLLEIPRILGKQRKPIMIDIVDKFSKNINSGYKYSFNILERIGYVFKIPVIVIGDDNIAKIYDKWRSMVVKIENKLYWVL